MSQIAKAFSNAYISKRLDGKISVCFSIDFLQLFKELSNVPDEVFDNLSRSGAQMMKNVEIIDEEINLYTMNSGLFKYKLNFSVSSETKSRTLSDVAKLSEARENIGKFLEESSRSQNIDPDTGDYTEQFINSRGNGTHDDLMKGIDILFDVYNSTILDDFQIQSFKLERIRIKNFIDTREVFNYLPSAIVLDTGNASDYFVDIENQFQENVDPSISIDRQRFKDSYKIEDTYTFKILGLLKIIQDYETNLMSFIRQGKTPSSLSRKVPGSKGISTSVAIHSIVFDDIFDAGNFRNGYDPGTLNFLRNLDVVDDNTFFLETVNFEGQGFFEDKDEIQNFIFNNIENVDQISSIVPLDTTATIGDAVLNDLSLNKGFEFNFVGTIEKAIEASNLKETSDIEILDTKDSKFLIKCSEDGDRQAIGRGSALKLLKELGRKVPRKAKAQLQYLYGYEANEENNYIMKEPIFLSSTGLASSVGSGKEYLFRIKVIQEGKTLPIYNEYFIKKV